MNYHHLLQKMSCLSLAVLLLAGCTGAPVEVTATLPSQPTVPPAPTATPPPTVTPVPTATPLPAITVCATGCDFTTLQAAIDAESTTAGDIIGLVDAIQTEANIQITKSVTIQGRGAPQTIVQAHAAPGAGTDRVIQISPGVTVTLRALTIRHGNPAKSPQSGGGIANEGTLTLERVVVSDNHGSGGGGIVNDGTLTLINSTVKDNRATGGIDPDLECETGGGIKDLSGVVTLIDSTVSGNTAVGKGGGIHIACKGTLVLTNSTISGNASNRNGGGLYIDGVGQFAHSTISGNTASSGGGLCFSGSREKGVILGQLNYTNTVIAGNTARLPQQGVADCHIGDRGSIGANSHNWVGDGTCSPAFSGDPLLGLLTDNGGDTQTHALLAGSPAIDAISPSSCLLITDQRGQPRGATCDIGAVEMQK